jgi:hypothetical protein
VSERICGKCGKPLGKAIGTWVFLILHCPACLRRVKLG